MEQKMGRNKVLLFFITLCLTNVALMADSVLAPAIGGIFETFGDQIGLVNFIISGAALVGVVSSLVTGQLTQTISKKTLLIFALALLAVGGILGAAVMNAAYVAFMRAMVGFSWGIVNVVAMGLLAEVFTDESKRSRMMGYFNSAMAAVGAVMSLVAGFLAIAAWQSVFRIFWVAIPILILVILFVPKTPPEGRRPAEAGVTTQERIPVVGFGLVALAFFVLSIAYGMITYQMALYVAERGLGDETLTGLYTSLGTVGSAVACVALGYLYPRLKSSSLLIGAGCMMLTFLLLYVTHSVALAGVANLLAGASFGWCFTYFYAHTPASVPPSRISFAMGIIAAATGLGFFASTYVASFAKNLMGVPQDQLAGIIPAGIAILAVVFAIGLVIVLREARQPQAEAQIGV